jgi:hypothetical protein
MPWRARRCSCAGRGTRHRPHRPARWPGGGGQRRGHRHDAGTGEGPRDSAFRQPQDRPGSGHPCAAHAVRSGERSAGRRRAGCILARSDTAPSRSVHQPRWRTCFPLWQAPRRRPVALTMVCRTACGTRPVPLAIKQGGSGDRAHPPSAADHAADVSLAGARPRPPRPGRWRSLAVRTSTVVVAAAADRTATAGAPADPPGADLKSLYGLPMEIPGA